MEPLCEHKGLLRQPCRNDIQFEHRFCANIIVIVRKRYFYIVLSLCRIVRFDRNPYRTPMRSGRGDCAVVLRENIGDNRVIARYVSVIVFVLVCRHNNGNAFDIIYCYPVRYIRVYIYFHTPRAVKIRIADVCDLVRKSFADKARAVRKARCVGIRRRQNLFQ